MAQTPNIFGEPSLALAPLAVIKSRLDLTGSTQHDTALARLALAVTRAFEGATARALVKRTACPIVLDGAAIEPGCGVVLEAATPVISIGSVHVDRSATDAVDVVFDATTEIDAGDYRLLHSGAGAHGWAPATIMLRSSAHPNGYGAANVQVIATFGYTPDDGAQGWALPAGEFAVPEDLVEAFLEQLALTWRRRDKPHLASEQFNASAGGGTIRFINQQLAGGVKELLAPYATPEAALNLGAADGAGALP